MRSEAPHRRRLWVSLALALVAGAACGGGSGHPDTGYGANASVPATVNCTDYCNRVADCLVDLCNEDTMSTNYTAAGQIVIAQCESVCSPALLAMFTQANWQCLFQTSCRQDFEHDACHVMASYKCN